MDRRQRLVAAGLPLVLLVAACSGAATPSPSTPVASVPAASEPAASEPAASQPAASEPAASASEGTAETYEVKVASGTVGSYLTGEDGKTLYTFKNDAVGSGKSTCSGGCATKWPAFTVDSKDQLKAGAGVTGALDVFTRDDGSMQVSYKGAPLYYYAADTKAGDTMGQGIGGVWYVANP